MDSSKPPTFGKKALPPTVPTKPRGCAVKNLQGSGVHPSRTYRVKVSLLPSTDSCVLLQDSRAALGSMAVTPRVRSRRHALSTPNAWALGVRRAPPEIEKPTQLGQCHPTFRCFQNKFTSVLKISETLNIIYLQGGVFCFFVNSA